MTKFRPMLWMVGALSAGSLLALVYFLPAVRKAPAFVSAIPAPLYKPSISREDIARAIGRTRIEPSSAELGYLPLKIKDRTYQARLTIDKNLQEKVRELFDRYDPVFAAFVALDPDTGKILAMVDHSHEGHRENLALQASFPAASVFKVITSAAALEENKAQAQSLIGFNGSNTSLYRRNIADDRVTRWTRFVSMEEALAKSVNTVFGKIAVHRLGRETLQKYADRFGFNQSLRFDMPVDVSVVNVPDDMFGLAESGSGYTKRQTMSPLQGALIAASVINNGDTPNPFIVHEVVGSEGERLYKAQSRRLGHPIEPETARKLSKMMENTITRGTARKEYRDYNHHPVLSKLFIGAKTGSLSGEHPEGKYDWFVGFAQSVENPSRKIAFASMIVNRKFWRVKSAHIAREALLEYFGRREHL